MAAHIRVGVFVRVAMGDGIRVWLQIPSSAISRTEEGIGGLEVRLGCVDRSFQRECR